MSANASATPEILDCGHAESAHSDFTRGYGIDAEGKRHCYACCGERDLHDMRESGRATLYLTQNPNPCTRRFGPWQEEFRISNWCGSLKIIPFDVKKGRHNFTGSRYDVWFDFEGTHWHGVLYGENTQVLHCKRLKQASR